MMSREPRERDDVPRDRYQQIADYLLFTAASSMLFNLFATSIGYRGVALVILAGGLVAMVGWLRRLPPRAAGETTRQATQRTVPAPRPAPRSHDRMPEHDSGRAGNSSARRRKPAGATNRPTERYRALLAGVTGIAATLAMVGGLVSLGRNLWPWIVVFPMVVGGVAFVIIMALGLDDDSEDPNYVPVATIVFVWIYQVPWLIGLGIHLWRGAHGEPDNWGPVASLVGIEVAFLAGPMALGWIRDEANRDRARTADRTNGQARRTRPAAGAARTRAAPAGGRPSRRPVPQQCARTVRAGTDMVGEPGQVHAVAFSPDGGLIATGGNGNTARLWDAATGKPFGVPLDPKLFAHGNDNTVVVIDPITSRGTWHTPSVVTVAFSPDGRFIAVGGDDNTVRLWKPDGHRVGRPFGVQTGSLKAVLFSPDGYLATGVFGHSVQLRNPITGEPVGQPIGWPNFVGAMAFGPDGVLATGSDDSTVRLWAPTTGQPVGQPLTGHNDIVTAIAFRPNGSILATGSRDSTVRLWNPMTGESVGQPLTGHIGHVEAVAFSPDGHLLATGSRDSTVRLWNPMTGEPVGQALTGHTDVVTAVAFSPNGRSLATTSTDGTLRLWRSASPAFLTGMFGPASTERARRHDR